MATLPPTFALEPRYKEQFAAFVLDGFSAFTAAMRIWPGDAGLASMVARDWPNDPYVTAYTAKLLAEREEKAKPATKSRQIKRIEDRLPTLTQENYLRGERLIAELSGHLEKAAPNSVTIDNSRNVIAEKVLVLRDHGTDDEWEQKLRQQQSKLIEHSS